ncbi:MAG: hypothetical protein K2L16_09855 [Muribaculaceae bacterium]|nr:hypothetical protein [Muribaculaceae bacterium]
METKPVTPPPFGTPAQNSTAPTYNQNAGARPAKENNGFAAGTVAGAGIAAAAGAAGFAAGHFSASAADITGAIEPEIIVEDNDIIDGPIGDVEIATVDDAAHTTVDATVEPQAVQSVSDEPIYNDVIEPEPADDSHLYTGRPDPGYVDPNEVAEAIIAEDMIDPNDIDSEDLFDFTDIGTVYTIEGDEMTVASFNLNGDEYAMVDINNDGLMDVIVDSYGNVVTDSDGYIMTADYTTDDIVDRLTSGDTYLAADDSELGSDIEDQMLNDLIS